MFMVYGILNDLVRPLEHGPAFSLTRMHRDRSLILHFTKPLLSQ